MRLSAAAARLEAPLLGDDRSFTGVSIDSRTVHADELFVALAGARHDGHDHLADAAARGAAGAMVARASSAVLPRLLVADTRASMGCLAGHWRSRFRLPVVAVTGSNGKTTVKEMLAAVLSRVGATLATRGNLNNDIGVPLTLFGLGETHRYAVVEMGANHAGEIAALGAIVRPTVSVVTQCAPAHLAGFGSIEGVARAKGEIFSALPDDGIAVVNADDPYADLWLRLAGTRRVLQFSMQRAADVRAHDRGLDADGHRRIELETCHGLTEVSLPLLGRHNVLNAAATVASALALGIAPASWRDGLQAMQPVSGRLELHAGTCGSRIVDDTYNANPGSLAAALETLAELPGRHWLVLGDMGELGADSEVMHRRAGAAVRATGVERLYTVGELAGLAADEFGAGAERCADVAAVAAAVAGDLVAGVTVLVKGSRTARMERVVNFLLGRR